MSRERALRMIRVWTIASGVAGIGLTGVLAVVAAQSFAGRTIATTGSMIRPATRMAGSSARNTSPLRTRTTTFARGPSL